MCLFLWDEERNNWVKIINIPKQIIKACTCLLSIKMKPKQSDFRLLLESSASKSKLDYLGEEFGLKRVLIFGIGHANTISTCMSRASCSPSSKPYSSTPTVLPVHISVLTPELTCALSPCNIYTVKCEVSTQFLRDFSGIMPDAERRQSSLLSSSKASSAVSLCRSFVEMPLKQQHSTETDLNKP